MIPQKLRHLCIALLLLSAVVSIVHGAPRKVASARPDEGKTEPSREKTLSPYFHVKSDDPETDKLPLKKTSADVNIAGVIAQVEITQVYENTGKNPIEAKYVFPASTRAAVHGMKMTIGERTIVAKIDERKQAKEKYEKAKEKGKTASLLQQQRPNVFQMNVANIMPGDTIKVKLRYSEMLVPENGEYEFVFPTVVGPRYSEEPAKDAPDTEKWIESLYQHEGKKPSYTFDMHVDISSGIPLKKVACSSHDVNVNFDGKKHASIELSPKDKYGGNRDFILKYVLAEKQIETGEMLFQGEEENFFVATVEPPQRVKTNMIPRREYIFVVDVSGSMNGFPLKTSKKVMRNLLNGLRPSDYFNVVFFAGGSFKLSGKSRPATQANVKSALNKLNQQRGGGGTRLLEGLKTAYNLPRIDENVSRTVVLATDGYVSVEQKAFDMIKDNLNNTNVFAFGIGSSVNRYLVRGVAKCGKGRQFVVTGPDEATSAAEEFRSYISAPVLTDIDVAFKGLETYEVEPPSYPDIFAERPLVVTGKYKGDPSGRIQVTGYTGKGKFNESVDITADNVADKYAPIKYVWARKRIARLSDYVGKDQMKEHKDQVTQLGLNYSMLTRYTSFVAIDKRVRNEEGDLKTVKQPLPMPKGVSDSAVGGRRGRGAASAVKRKASGKAMQFSKAPTRSAPKKAEASEYKADADAPGKTKAPPKTAIKLGDDKTVQVSVTDFEAKGKGKLTGDRFQNRFVKFANILKAFKMALTAAYPVDEVKVKVPFKKGVAQEPTLVEGEFKETATPRMKKQLKALVSRLIPPRFNGHVVLEMDTE